MNTDLIIAFKTALTLPVVRSCSLEIESTFGSPKYTEADNSHTYLVDSERYSGTLFNLQNICGFLWLTDFRFFVYF